MKKKLLLIGALLLFLGLGSAYSVFQVVGVSSIGCYHNGQLYRVGEMFTEVVDGRLLQYTCTNDGNFVCKDMGPADAK